MGTITTGHTERFGDPEFSSLTSYEEAVRMIANCNICDVPCVSLEAAQTYADVRVMLNELLTQPYKVATAINILKKKGLSAFIQYYKQNTPYQEH